MRLLLLVAALAAPASAADVPFYLRTIDGERDVSALNENFRSLVNDITLLRSDLTTVQSASGVSTSTSSVSTTTWSSVLEEDLGGAVSSTTLYAFGGVSTGTYRVIATFWPTGAGSSGNPQLKCNDSSNYHYGGGYFSGSAAAGTFNDTNQATLKIGPTGDSGAPTTCDFLVHIGLGMNGPHVIGQCIMPQGGGYGGSFFGGWLGANGNCLPLRKLGISWSGQTFLMRHVKLWRQNN